MHSWFNSGSIFKNTVKIPIAAKAIQVNEIQYIARLVQKKCIPAIKMDKESEKNG